MSDPNYEIIWKPQPGPQVDLITCPVGEILFGGARGGGKTDAVIGKWVYHSNQYGDKAHGVMFRRTFKQLEEVLKRTREIYPRIGATYSVSNQMWTFPNGSTLKLRHLDNEVDAQAYQGHQYTFLVFEEATNWPTSRPMDMLRATLRSAAGVPPQLILTANPGGPGHNWVKSRYISPAKQGYTLIKDADTGLDRVFIPSKLSDNKILTSNDKTYAARLKGTGPGALVKAWLDGDWDIVAGGFFDDVFNSDKHILPTFELPRDWQLIMSFDWGFSAPASMGVFARVTSQPSKLPFRFPIGSLIRVKEWYTVQRDDSGYVKANIGQRLTNEELGAGIASRIKTLWSPRAFVADPSIFTEQGGPSAYERMRVGAREMGVNLIMNKADNNRQTGWSRVRELLKNSAEETPEKAGLWIMDNCEHWLRTVPVLQADRLKPDDVDTNAEDHAADDTRYACMIKSRAPRMAKISGY